MRDKKLDKLMADNDDRVGPYGMKIRWTKSRCPKCGNQLVAIPGAEVPPFIQFECEGGGCGYSMQSVVAECAKVQLVNQVKADGYADSPKKIIVPMG